MRVYLQKIIKGLEEFSKRKLKDINININIKLKERRLEKEKWDKIKKDIEVQERKKFERDKIKAKYDNEVSKVKAKIKRGPLWKQAVVYGLKTGKELWEEPKKTKK